MTEKQDQPQPPAPAAESALSMVQELRNAGWSLRRIADHLQAEGLPSPTRWKGKSARWTVRTVKRILEIAPPEDQLSSADSPPQPMTFTGPITVVATGTLRFAGPVTMNGPESSREETTSLARPEGSIVERRAGATCGSSHD